MIVMKRATEIPEFAAVVEGGRGQEVRRAVREARDVDEVAVHSQHTMEHLMEILLLLLEI